MGGSDMHEEVIRYCKSVQSRHPSLFENKKVLDLGSWDTNGNNRYLFDGCTYTGVDTQEGANVDIVARAHELSFSPASFDVVISTEMLEHDPYFYRTLPKALELLKPGGLLLLTCAGPDRPIHGTQDHHPGTNLSSSMRIFKNYYRPLELEDFQHILNPSFTFSPYELTYNRNQEDLYFHGIKR